MAGGRADIACATTAAAGWSAILDHLEIDPSLLVIIELDPSLLVVIYSLLIS